MRLIHSSDFPENTPTPAIRALMEGVSESSLRRSVEKISVPRNFYTERENNQAIARWLANQFADWGYEIHSQGPFGNIVALPRKKFPTLLLVGAHYDSVPQTPGADDNGSAVAGILACAEILSRVVPPLPVCFVAFNCEENHLAGSKDFVTNFLTEANFKITQAHILEMIGFATAELGSQKTPPGLPIRIPDPGDFLGLLANHHSAIGMEFILRQARRYLPAFKTIGLEVPLGAEKVFPVLARSDHVPFWDHGIPAVMWTDTSEYRNPNYHRATDTPETLNYPFLTEVTKLLVACAAETTHDRLA